ncbi:hypothetical protein [Chitinimonas sp. BJYL2]|uniref:hypothetical protein n=1 Tax=Chitinimonas sp. BJYL2 TaxID=2976696 RepID=UPI0027E52849|nr:hypothetical protein [Chitinimonas sp. BJYL2]
MSDRPYDIDDVIDAHEPKPRTVWLMYVLWPSFVMAGVMDALVFAVVDPSDLTWFGMQPMDLPRQAIYTMSFFVMWAVIAASSALTLWFAQSQTGIRPSLGK